MGTTPAFGFRYPELGSSADGPDGFKDLAEDVEGVLSSAAVASYTPAWISLGLNGNTNPSGGVRTGRYAVDRGVCTVWAEIVFNSGTSGGRGNLGVSLPVVPRAGLSIQFITCFTHIPSNNSFHFGQSVLYAGSINSQPTFFINGSNSGWISTNASGNAGLGVPLVPVGQGIGYPVENGGGFRMMGSYFV